VKSDSCLGPTWLKLRVRSFVAAAACLLLMPLAAAAQENNQARGRSLWATKHFAAASNMQQVFGFRMDIRRMFSSAIGKLIYDQTKNLHGGLTNG
jgi:hypothetical protein